MSKLQDKQFYIEQIKLGKSHRQISKNMNSSSIIRDELLKEGVIVLSKTVLDPKTRRNHRFYTLVDKPFVDTHWSDGTLKSRGNAFDLSTAKGIFSKSELAAAVNKGKPNNYNPPVQIIAYSRA